MAAIGEGRSLRSELNVPLSARPPLLVLEATADQRRVLESNAPALMQMLRVRGVEAATDVPTGAIPFVVAGVNLALPVAEFIDLAAEKARLAKEVANLAGEQDRIGKKLGNPDFVARAPEEVVDENRERLAEVQDAKAKLEAALERLKHAG